MRTRMRGAVGAGGEKPPATRLDAIATTPAQRLGAYFARFPSRVNLPRMGVRVGLRIDLFEACSAFTHALRAMESEAKARSPR